MNILIVNDDGITSKGLQLLVKAASHFGDVYVSAPGEHQSAKSHSISIKSDIQIEEVDFIIGATRAIKVFGTPADCIRAATKIFDIDFDIVFSGINEGENIGKDILYSGTVAAAYEASVYQIPAVAISASDLDLEYLYDETHKIIDEVLESKLHLRVPILNINFPHKSFEKVLGVRLTKMGLRNRNLDYVKTERENFYKMKYSVVNYQESDDSDVKAFNEGYVSLTPLTLDRTDHQLFQKLIKNK